MTERTSLYFRLSVFVVALTVLGACRHSRDANMTREIPPPPAISDLTLQDDNLPTFQDSTVVSNKKNVMSEMQTGKPAVIFSSTVGVKDLTLEVLSNGCTQAGDFEIQYAETTKNEIMITVLRTKPDGCRKMPAVISVTLPMDEELLPGKQVLLSNEITPYPTFKRK